MNEPKRILIVRTDRLGDVILSTPVIENLRSRFPKSHIAFMCRPYTKDAIEGNPYLNEVIIYDKYSQHKGLGGTIRFVKLLRKKQFDWAIILHPTNRSHLVTFLAGIPMRIGWNKDMSFLLTKRVPHTKQQGKKHEMEYTLDILRELNIPVVSKNLYFPISPQAKKKVDEILNLYGIEKEERFVVVHPSASCPSKRWPDENFSELVSMIKDHLNLNVIVIAAPTEKQHGQKIIEENDVVDIRGKLPIAQVGALLKKSSLFISNDSGPVHIAASLKIPVISIFGRKDPGLSPLRWRPLGENSYFFHKDVGCQKCLAHDCNKGFLCLREIKPQEVFELAKKILYTSQSNK